MHLDKLTYFKVKYNYYNILMRNLHIISLYFSYSLKIT